MVRFYCKLIDNELCRPSSNFYTIQLEHTKEEGHTFFYIYMTIQKCCHSCGQENSSHTEKRGHRLTMYHSLVVFYIHIDSFDNNNVKEVACSEKPTKNYQLTLKLYTAFQLKLFSSCFTASYLLYRQMLVVSIKPKLSLGQ